MVTVTAVRPLARFGAMDIDKGVVKNFIEKPKTESGWVNGVSLLISQKVMSYISSCYETWEMGPLKRLVKDNKLAAFKHEGFGNPWIHWREKSKFFVNYGKKEKLHGKLIIIKLKIYTI